MGLKPRSGDFSLVTSPFDPESDRRWCIYFRPTGLYVKFCQTFFYYLVHAQRPCPATLKWPSQAGVSCRRFV